MAASPTIATSPPEDISMDYARLRDEAVRLLGQLAGAQWTDYNTHDPGITILEQLCYAITDLGYRTSFPLLDRLPDGDPGMPGAAEILTTDPVTRADVREVALDVGGVGNAWVEAEPAAALPFYHDPAARQLVLRVDPTAADARPVQLRGIDRVLVQTTDALPGEQALDLVSARLHAGRTLGSDVDVELVGTFPVALVATLEVDAVDDAAALAAAVLEAVELYFAPKAHFEAVADALAAGRAIEDVLDGPPLAHGVIDALPGRQRTVYTSDLLHAILDVRGVKAVRSLAIQGPSASPQRWALDVPAGSVATLAPSSQLVLVRNDLPLRVDADAVARDRAALRAARTPAPAADALPAPVGTPRDLTRFRSLQYQLPEAYGVGPVGVAASAPALRRAQVRQLAAYLLIFDQLFADALAQIAHATELLSPADAPLRSYFALPVEDVRLGLAELLPRDAAAQRAWLDTVVEVGDPRERRLRFLAHLLARFAEELGDHARLSPVADVDAATDDLVADRAAFLRDYARLSRGRGSGYDVSRYSPDQHAGFEDRLRYKLGMRGDARLHVVEHVLLRPLAEDVAQLADEGDPQVPLLAEVAEADPWSLHVSVVLQEPAVADASFEQLVVQTVAAEVPAHLRARVHWFGAAGTDDWRAFVTAWSAFRAAYRDYRALALHGAPRPALLQLGVRDARDRLVDLLGLGRTYPLRDIALPEQIVVTPGARATIALEFSQPDVIYTLCDRDTGAPILDGGAPIAVGGTGGPIAFVTPPIDVDHAYRVHAVKRDGAGTDQQRDAWLRDAVRVVEGVDSSLVASIELPLLDPRIDNPKPGDARIGDWNVAAPVEVLDSQEGVTYELIVDAPDLSNVAQHRVVSAAPVVGTGGRIELHSVAMPEDIDLRVRGQKVTGGPAAPVTRTGVLDVVLLLRVRANPGIGAALVPAFVAYGGAAVVRTGVTQTSAAYRVYRARVRDRDFVFDTAPVAPVAPVTVTGGGGVRVPDRGLDPGGVLGRRSAAVAPIAVTVDGGRVVRVARPPQPWPWADLPDFAAVAAPVAGTGAAIDLAIGDPGKDDSFLVVQATKSHQTGRLGTGSDSLPSAVQLDAALALLVRPSPDPGLRMAVTMQDGATTGTLLVTGGQPGVFYTAHVDGQADPVGLPAYMQQRDDRSVIINKGIEQVRVEVDAVVTRDPPVAPLTPGTAAPLPPLVATAKLPAGTVLRVDARKAMSSLTAPLARHAVLDAAPAVTAPASVVRGASADVRVASAAGEQYWLLIGDARVADPVTGTGASLALATGPLAARTVVTVVAVAAPAGDTIPVERRVDVTIGVVEPG